LDDTALEWIAKQGYTPEPGARTLRRTVEKYLEDQLAEEILMNSFSEGSLISVTVKEEKLSFSEANKVETVENHETAAE
jgi:ATP-dependent Clp protease ATP-binding subunit ClpA